MLTTRAVKIAILYGLISSGVSYALPAGRDQGDISGSVEAGSSNSQGSIHSYSSIAKRSPESDFVFPDDPRLNPPSNEQPSSEPRVESKEEPKDENKKNDSKRQANKPDSDPATDDCDDYGVQRNAPWSLARLSRSGMNSKDNADGNYTYCSTGKNTMIYILSSGVDEHHEELGNRVRWAQNYRGGPYVDDEDIGTGLASIAAGKTLGLAKDADIVAVKLSDKEGASSPQSLHEIVDFIITDHERHGAGKRAVVLYTFNWEWKRLSSDPTKRLNDAGILFVAGAGYGRGMYSCQFGPAIEGKHDGKIIVSVSNSSNKASKIGNTGDCTDVYAPGEDIKAASTGSERYRKTEGSSAAAAYVAGLASYYWQLNPSASPRDIKEMITKKSPVVKIDDAGTEYPLANNGLCTTSS